MSAILEALKKLEADAAAKNAAPLHGRGRQAARFRPAHPLVMIAAGMVVLAVFGAGVWKYALHTARRASPSTAIDMRASAQRIQDRDIKTADDDMAPNPAGATTISPIGPEAENLPSPQPGGADAEPGKPAFSPRPAAKTAPAPKTAAQTPASPATATAETDRPTATPPAVPAPDRTPAPQIMEDGPLTLQAISWAASPENRIAVINGRICREGERVDGYRVRRINAEDVWVAEGERIWRLVFNLR